MKFSDVAFLAQCPSSCPGSLWLGTVRPQSAPPPPRDQPSRACWGSVTRSPPLSSPRWRRRTLWASTRSVCYTYITKGGEERSDLREIRNMKHHVQSSIVTSWERRNQPVCNHCDVEFSHSKTSVLKRHLYSKHSPIGMILEHKDVGEPDIEEEEEASFNDT